MKIGNEIVSMGLIIKPEYANLILSGAKTWEMRTKNTAVRGRIAIIGSGTGQILGTITLCGSKGPLNQVELENSEAKHRVTDLSLSEKWNTAWIMREPKLLKEPIPYTPKKGAMIWVRL